ncbi:MAG: TSUP family transporter [Gammaproteobacteria bacterium]|nr:TSUP family transporter [Gammaproteobacteria bacterium]
MEILSLDILLILCAVAAVAGFVDAIAGGGGLITLPALLWAGLSPTQALATNKLQGSFGTMMASWHFIRNGMIDIRTMVPEILLTFIGAVSGTLLVQHLHSAFLADIIPILLIVVAVYTLLSPRMTDDKAKQRMSRRLFAISVGFGVGFYDGFFGPGTGSFFTIGFVALMGLGLRDATAHAKVLNFTSNIAAMIFFAVGGHMVWLIGLSMGMAQMCGAWLGAHVVIHKGSGIIKPLLVVVSIAMAVRLLFV